MKNQVIVKNSSNSLRYMSEFELFDGDHYVTFNVIGIDTDNNEITVAVSEQGRISVVTYDLLSDVNETLYFEYGVMLERIALDDFTSEGR